MILSNITPRARIKGTVFRGGGGGGVTSYSQLNDKPQINDVTIEDNHDGHYYGLANQSDILIEGYNQVPGESIYRLHDVTIEGRNYTVAYLPFVGADGVDDGKVGLVPAPTAADENKVLFGDGSWKDTDTDDLSNYTWTSLVSTTGTSSPTPIPAGTKWLVVIATLSGIVTLIAKERISNINKILNVTNESTFNVGYEYYDTSGNHTNISMSVSSDNVTVNSGYSTVTAKVYALS